MRFLLLRVLLSFANPRLHTQQCFRVEHIPAPLRVATRRPTHHHHSLPAAAAAFIYCLWLDPLGGYCGALRPTSFVATQGIIMFDLFCDLLLDMPDDMFDDDAARDAALDYEDEAQLSGGCHYDEDDEEEE
eukprot:scaffold3356_cov82-Skeletonema_dohrnii-CCMP3373.AAC.2